MREIKSGKREQEDSTYGFDELVYSRGPTRAESAREGQKGSAPEAKRGEREQDDSTYRFDGRVYSSEHTRAESAREGPEEKTAKVRVERSKVLAITRLPTLSPKYSYLLTTNQDHLCPLFQ
jgi:hypothetical protein